MLAEYLGQLGGIFFCTETEHQISLPLALRNNDISKNKCVLSTLVHVVGMLSLFHKGVLFET